MVYLTWTPNPSSENVDSYEVELDGNVVANVTDAEYDLSSISDGQYTARVRAHNMWGWSEYSDPFAFVKSVPSVPVNIGLEVA